MHSEGKYLLHHDGLSAAQAQERLCLRVRVSDPAEYMVLAIKAGTVWQIRPDTYQGSVHQPMHVKELPIHIGPLQDGLDGFSHSSSTWLHSSKSPTDLHAGPFQLAGRTQTCRRP